MDRESNWTPITFGDIMDAGLWDEYCKATGTSVWAVNEGQIKSDQVVQDIPSAILVKLLLK